MGVGYHMKPSMPFTLCLITPSVRDYSHWPKLLNGLAKLVSVELLFGCSQFLLLARSHAMRNSRSLTTLKSHDRENTVCTQNEQRESTVMHSVNNQELLGHQRSKYVANIVSAYLATVCIRESFFSFLAGNFPCTMSRLTSNNQA